MGSTWHPECFCCEMCNKELADLGFIKNQGRALCHECNAKVGLLIVLIFEPKTSLFQVKAAGMGKYMCQKCHAPIEGEPLRFRGEYYCPYHFNCTGCGVELTSSAREVKRACLGEARHGRGGAMMGYSLSRSDAQTYHANLSLSRISFGGRCPNGGTMV